MRVAILGCTPAVPLDSNPEMTKSRSQALDLEDGDDNSAQHPASDLVVYLGADVPVRRISHVLFRTRFKGEVSIATLVNTLETPGAAKRFTLMRFAQTKVETEAGVTTVSTQLRLLPRRSKLTNAAASTAGGFAAFMAELRFNPDYDSSGLLLAFFVGMAAGPLLAALVRHTIARLRPVDVEAHQRRFEAKCREALGLGSALPPAP